MKNEEKLLRVKFCKYPELGPRTFHLLMDKYSSLTEAKEACLAGRDKKMFSETLRRFFGEVDEIDMQYLFDEVAKRNLQMVVLGEKDYPPNLADIYDPPLVLFYKGDIALASNKHKLVAVVGTR
ncbi:hypothetical protein GF389_00270, partial [Candidatus Dojkabacteria bacterium]|nr:hypothetical protein [Candidatus Dojkabacteria bacterium]